jgi:hypothetical protein
MHVVERRIGAPVVDPEKLFRRIYIGDYIRVQPNGPRPAKYSGLSFPFYPDAISVKREAIDRDLPHRRAALTEEIGVILAPDYTTRPAGIAAVLSKSNHPEQP